MKIHTFLVGVCLILMLSAFQARAADPPPPSPGFTAISPGAELWREVRQRDVEITGTSQVKSDGANVLINVAGENWRQYRVNTLIPTAGEVIFWVLVAIVVFRLLRGKIMLQGGRTGVKILRFTLSQRFAHWTTAILFVILGLTGLILLLGRKHLIPFIGVEGFSTIAATTKFLHDYLGPLFIFSLTYLFVLFVRDNLPSPKVDLQWILRGGGLFGGHAHAGRYNAGEKAWFWVAMLGGLVLIISGVVLDFPIFGQTRATMEFYLVVHGIAAVVLIAVSFGHIYMGTAALEGTFEVMKTGYCDASWARDHHDLWYEKVKHEVEPAQQNPAQENTESG